MRAGDGVAIEECEELPESIEERPVGKQTDTLVGVDRAWACGAAVGAAVGGRHRSVGRGGFVWIRAQETQLGALLISQTLLREGLIELNGSAVHLKQGTCWIQSSSSADRANIEQFCLKTTEMTNQLSKQLPILFLLIEQINPQIKTVSALFSQLIFCSNVCKHTHVLLCI